MSLESRQKIIDRWIKELNLNEAQGLLFGAMTINMCVAELARPFIEQDLANGASIVQLTISHPVTRSQAGRIRKESGYSEIIEI